MKPATSKMEHSRLPAAIQPGVLLTQTFPLMLLLLLLLSWYYSSNIKELYPSRSAGKKLHIGYGAVKRKRWQGSRKHCRKGESVSYCHERRMGNGHRDGWRLISPVQWFRGGSGANFVPPSGYLLLPLDNDNASWISNTWQKKVTFSGSND